MSKTNVAKLVVLAAIVAGTILLAVLSHRPSAPKVGDAAPDFALVGLRAPSVSLRDYRRSVVVLNFWATWCLPCVEEMPSLNRFAKELDGRGVTVIGVSVDSDLKALEKFVAEGQIAFPIARDPEQTLAARYGTFKFPESFLIDTEGKIAEKLVGAVDWQDPRLIARVQKLARQNERSSR